MGTSTMVSSAVQDWNGRNSSQGVEGKEETKKKWESETEKNRDSGVVEKLKDTNKDGDGREIDSNLQKGVDENVDEQKMRKEKKVEEGFAEVDEDIYAQKKEEYAKEEEMYAKESEEMYARNEELYAKAKESCFCWPPSGPSQPKSRHMPKEKETKGFQGSKNQLNSLRKAAGEEYFS